MHGVRRSDTEDVGPSDEEQAQVREYRALHDRVIALWADVEHDALADAAAEEAAGLWSSRCAFLAKPDESPLAVEVVETTRAMLLHNPEFMTAWALRRWALRRSGQAALAAEGAFGIEAIRANPKAYGAWHHRRWLLATVRAAEGPAGYVATRARELALCDKLLALDARNFHCWNYRLWLCSASPSAVCESSLVQAEFDATTRMLHANFSNYSAWHRRALLLPHVLAAASSGKSDRAVQTDTGNSQATRDEIYDREAVFVRAAYWTQPADQSAWFYLRQLVAQARDPKAAAASELAAVEELLAEEPDAAHAHAAAVHLARMAGLPVDCARIARLAQVDPLRRGMYLSWMRESS